MGRVAAHIILDEEETETLEHWQRSSTVSSGLCFRAAIVLDCVAGYSGEGIAERHRTSQQTVSQWRRSFA
jgi:hypothetical protein